MFSAFRIPIFTCHNSRDKRLFLFSALSANTIVFRRRRFRCTVAVRCTRTSKPYELAHFILSLANNAQISATTSQKKPFVRVHPSKSAENCSKKETPGQLDSIVLIIE